MNRQKHTAEEIINKLREAEVLQAKGISIECSTTDREIVLRSDFVSCALFVRLVSLSKEGDVSIK